MAKIVGALVGDKRFYEFADQPPEFLHGALGAFAQRGFEFRECHFDWVEVWRIGGQIADCSASKEFSFATPKRLLQQYRPHAEEARKALDVRSQGETGLLYRAVLNRRL